MNITVVEGNESGVVHDTKGKLNTVIFGAVNNASVRPYADGSANGCTKDDGRVTDDLKGRPGRLGSKNYSSARLHFGGAREYRPAVHSLLRGETSLSTMSTHLSLPIAQACHALTFRSLPISCF